MSEYSNSTVIDYLNNSSNVGWRMLIHWDCCLLEPSGSLRPPRPLGSLGLSGPPGLLELLGWKLVASLPWLHWCEVLVGVSVLFSYLSESKASDCSLLNIECVDLDHLSTH